MFSLAFDCKYVSSCVAFNTDAKGKTCDPRDLERQPGFTQKYSWCPGPSCCPTRSCVAPRTSIRLIVLALRMRTLPLPLRMLYLTTYINWPCKGTMFRPSLDLRSIGSSFAGIGTPEL